MSDPIPAQAAEDLPVEGTTLDGGRPGDGESAPAEATEPAPGPKAATCRTWWTSRPR